MPIPPPGEPSGDSRVRFHVAVQNTRLVVWTLGGLLAMLSRSLGAGTVDVGYAEILAYVGLIHLSTLLFREAYRRGLDRAMGVSLTLIWMVVDIAGITGTIARSGGVESPWFIWYLSNAAAAAFVGGRAAAFAVGAANTAAYLGMLVSMGQVHGLDASLWLPLMRMGFLYGTAFFFLRAALALQERQRLIKRLQQEQEQRVQQLLALTQDLDQGTRALAEANIQIREADRMKSQFLANMSHELRTPLNSIIGFSEILLDRLVGEIPTKYVKFLHNIHSSGQHLLGIINDILDLSKVEAGKMEVHAESFRVPAVIEGVLNVMHGMSSRRRISFEVDAPESLPALEADPAKFKQILYNLLSNAVKFSPEQSTVWVSARELGAAESPIGEPSMTISVKDKGIGIGPADQQLIFHEFRQADASATRQFGGTGLGLSLVKKFVELQGGIVTLESELGRGSTFSATLPLRSRGAAGGLARAEAQPPPPAENRVLVVEDDLVAYQSLSRTLSEAGFAPVRARHGEEAIEMARSLRPSAITLDLALPGLSGWDVLRELKRDPATRAIPVVIISMMDNRELGLTLGADDYFLKPVDRQQLVERLTEIAPPAPPRRARLLLVDDDPAIHEFLHEELSRLGYSLDHAYSGSEGVEMAIRTRPDALILDLIMPDVTGFEVAATLKERRDTAGVPIVVLTAKDLSEAEAARLRGKIAALVQKGRAATANLVAAIRELESRAAHEVARAR